MIDARIPILAAQGAQVNLVDMYQQAQEMKYREEVMAQRKSEIEARQAEQQTARQRQQAEMVAKLASGVTDEASYQQRMAAAKAYGMDVSGAPANFDPEWVQTQRIIAETFLKPEGQKELTTTAQELAEAGYEPGTPEFQRAMAQRIQMKDSKIVTTTAGGMAGVYGEGGYRPFVLPNDGSQQAGAPAMTPGSNPESPMPTISSPDEARRLPPGSQFRTPDGRIMRVPGGAGSNASGGF